MVLCMLEIIETYVSHIFSLCNDRYKGLFSGELQLLWFRTGYYTRWIWHASSSLDYVCILHALCSPESHGENISMCCVSSVCMFSVYNVRHSVCLFVPQGLTIMAVSSLREGSVSVGWGPRAESLLLLTNRGVSVENTRTHTHLISAGSFEHFFST